MLEYNLYESRQFYQFNWFNRIVKHLIWRVAVKKVLVGVEPTIAFFKLVKD